MLRHSHCVAESNLTASTENLIAMMRSPDLPIEDIVQRVEQIPGISDALLERANSSEFALQHQIVRVAHAIAVLGIRRAEETVRLCGSHNGPPAPHFRNRQSQTGQEPVRS